MLRSFEFVVIFFTHAEQALRNAHQTTRFTTVAREYKVDDRTPNPAIAILEMVDGSKPQVGERRLHQTIRLGSLVEPVEQCIHLGRNKRGRRGFIMNLLVADAAANNVHRLGMRAIGADKNPGDAGEARREQSGLPTLQPFMCEELVRLSDSVIHDIEETVNVSGDILSLFTGNA